MVRSIVWGIIIVAIGAWVWISNVNPQALPGPVFARDWPLIIVVLGLMSIVEGIVRIARRRRWSRLWWGIVVTLVGLWIWASKLGLPDVYQFSRSWPVLIVLLGLFIVYKSVRRWQRRRVRQVDVIGDLEQGRIDVDEAVERLKKRNGQED
jgi:hypothetical protein